MPKANLTRGNSITESLNKEEEQASFEWYKQARETSRLLREAIDEMFMKSSKTRFKRELNYTNPTYDS